MAVTTKQIAELVGVSRGTVDRALHNRGRVDRDVSRRIKQVAQELGYRPNVVGRALALTRKPIKIGVIVQSSETAFMQLVLSGIQKAYDELQVFGVQLLLKRLHSIDTKQAVRALEELITDGADGIALLPVDDEQMRQKLKSVCEKGIPVVTFNSDISGTGRMCFVGLDNFKSGQTAAGLMQKMLLSGVSLSRGLVLVITGHLSNAAHNCRVEGFCSELRKIAPEIEILPIQACSDDDARSFQIVERTLHEHPTLSGIFVAANGQDGVCCAIERCLSPSRKRPCIVTYDLTPKNKEHLLKGEIDFVIGQDAHTQGYEPLMVLYRYLFLGTVPEKESLFTEIRIKTQYNI